MRFAAYGWHVIPNVDGHDPSAVAAAIAEARARPVEAHAHLLQDRHRQGLAQQGRHRTTCTARRSATRKSPPRARRSAGRTRPSRFPRRSTRPGTSARAARELEARLERRASPPTRRRTRSSRAEFRRRMAGELPPNWERGGRRRCSPGPPRRPRPSPRARPRSSRSRRIAPHLPELLGGSADLTGSNLTNWSGSKPVTADGRPATTCTSACASSAWPPSATASRCTAASSPTRAPSSPSPTTRATRCAWPRS